MDRHGRRCACRNGSRAPRRIALPASASKVDSSTVEATIHTRVAAAVIHGRVRVEVDRRRRRASVPLPPAHRGHMHRRRRVVRGGAPKVDPTADAAACRPCPGTRHHAAAHARHAPRACVERRVRVVVGGARVGTSLDAEDAAGEHRGKVEVVERRRLQTQLPRPSHGNRRRVGHPRAVQGGFEGAPSDGLDARAVVVRSARVEVDCCGARTARRRVPAKGGLSRVGLVVECPWEEAAGEERSGHRAQLGHVHVGTRLVLRIGGHEAAGEGQANRVDHRARRAAV